jgi:hypothetical protein
MEKEKKGNLGQKNKHEKFRVTAELDLVGR